jgi:hypothetical protein
MSLVGLLRNYWFEILLFLLMVVFFIFSLGFMVGWDCLLYGVGCSPGSNVTGV